MTTVFIPCHSVCSVVIGRLLSAQRDSGNSNFGRLSVVLCWPHGQKTENGPAQLDSIMSNLGMGLIGPIGLMVQKPVMKTTPAQRDSGISNLVLTLCPLRPLRLNLLCAQRDSGNSNLVLTPSPLHPLRLTDGCPVLYACRMGNALPAQRDSGNSNLPEVRIQESGVRMKTENRKTRMRPAQRDSGNSKLGTGGQGIFTMQIGNKTRFLTCGWDYKKQNVSAQRYSKMSILKIETENSLPQRHSKMSNLNFRNIVPAKRSEQAMFTMQIKNKAGWFMGKREDESMGKGNSRLTTKNTKRHESGKVKNKSTSICVGRKYTLINISVLFSCLSCFSWLKNRLLFAQQDSGIYKLGASYIPSGMRLSGNSQNHSGIFRETCKVYFSTAPEAFGNLYFHQKSVHSLSLFI